MHLAATVLPVTWPARWRWSFSSALASPSAARRQVARGIPQHRQRFFAWALLPSQCRRVMAYAHRLPPVRGAGAEPRCADLRRRTAITGFRSAFAGGAAAMFILTLYHVFLLARTAFVERPPALVEAARTRASTARRVLAR
jgi:hypothetical protein